MIFKFDNKVTLNLKDDVHGEYFLANRSLGKNANQIKDLFLEHGYDLVEIPGEFIKIFSFDDKEVFELTKVLDEIDRLGLREIFNANLRVSSFRQSFLDRVKMCLDKKVPILNSDNTFIKSLLEDDINSEDKDMVDTPIKVGNEENLD